ncbi:hypothetical protein AVEN_124251-1 [Araneus ventricosus]|uniref:Uncharacterized protein n=1 Tax=Araneus ventricosus TaxID=182803 RepID=A0A4Y1ZLC4_ARAVE|nr:hypothetical protein AVEN_124251-1 [Araneus ventricosus]
MGKAEILPTANKQNRKLVHAGIIIPYYRHVEEMRYNFFSNCTIFPHLLTTGARSCLVDDPSLPNGRMILEVHGCKIDRKHDVREGLGDYGRSGCQFYEAQQRENSSKFI